MKKAIGYVSIGFLSRVSTGKQGMSAVESRLQKIREAIGQEVAKRDDFMQIDIRKENADTYVVRCGVHIIRHDRLKALLALEKQVTGIKRVEEVLKERKMSKLQLANLAGITPSDFYLVMSGNKPFYPEWWRRVARALGKAEKDLFEQE